MSLLIKYQANSRALSGKVTLCNQIIANMEAKQHSSGSESGGPSLMLTGDPGVGKTSFIKQFASITGMHLITIEVPHIVDETIMNIPFITYTENSTYVDKATGEQVVKTTAKGNGVYDIQLADSHLFNEIQKRKTRLTDKAYLKNIAAFPADSKKLWSSVFREKNFDVVPDNIDDICGPFTCILFLDEYYRTVTPRIRNMLRDITNGRIGSHYIPKHCFIIYASNLKDFGGEGGVDDMQQNEGGGFIEFANPDKAGWFAHIVAKYDGDSKVVLKEDVVDTFASFLDEKTLSHFDEHSIVRSSPRRWEQLLIYVNAALPCKDQAAANHLLRNVQTNFMNYKTLELSGLYKVALDAISDLIDRSHKEDGSNITGKGASIPTSVHWEQTLAHQIEMKKKLGHHRKYIPVISGEPGIGKTSVVAHVAKDQDLRLIRIDCSSLDPDKISGMPVADTSGRDEDGKGAMRVKFTMSQLYRQIVDEMRAKDAEYLKANPSAKSTYAKREWKYLLFFDELNRTSTRVFNALRRVILEKDFGEDVLPQETIVIAAINPNGNGTELSDLTSHMVDVMDIIDAKPSWKVTKKFIDRELSRRKPVEAKKKSRAGAAKVASAVSSNENDIVANSSEKLATALIYGFVKHFTSRTKSLTADERPFFLAVGNEDVYINPRDYTLFTQQTVATLNRCIPQYLDEYTDDMDGSEQNTSVANENFKQNMREILVKAMDSLLHMILHRNQRDDEDGHTTRKLIHEWVRTDNDFDIIDDLIIEQNVGEVNTADTGTTSLAEAMLRVIRNPGSGHLGDNEQVRTLIDNSTEAEFVQQMLVMFVRTFNECILGDNIRESLINIRVRKFDSYVAMPNGQYVKQAIKNTRFGLIAEELFNALTVFKTNHKYVNAINGGVAPGGRFRVGTPLFAIQRMFSASFAHYMTSRFKAPGAMDNVYTMYDRDLFASELRRCGLMYIDHKHHFNDAPGPDAFSYTRDLTASAKTIIPGSRVKSVETEDIAVSTENQEIRDAHNKEIAAHEDKHAQDAEDAHRKNYPDATDDDVKKVREDAINSHEFMEKHPAHQSADKLIMDNIDEHWPVDAPNGVALDGVKHSQDPRKVDDSWEERCIKAATDPSTDMRSMFRAL